MSSVRCRLNLLALSLPLIVAAPAVHAALIQNGGFETGSFSSWTKLGDVFIGSIPVYGSIGSSALDGNYAAVFNAGDTAPNAVCRRASQLSRERIIAFLLFTVGPLAKALPCPPQITVPSWEAFLPHQMDRSLLRPSLHLISGPLARFPP